jgi:hypothetical protein
MRGATIGAIERGVGGPGGALRVQLRREALVGVEMKHPGMAQRQVGLRVGALRGEGLERVGEDPRAGGPRDGLRAVGRTGVEHDDVVAPPQRGEAGGQGPLLVEREHEDREHQRFSDSAAYRSAMNHRIHQRETTAGFASGNSTPA